MARDFSGIEDLLEFYIEKFVGNAEIAQIFIKRMSFSMKCEKLRELINCQFDKDRVTKEWFLNWIKLCEESAKKRNMWLHTPYALDGERGVISKIERCRKSKISKIDFVDVDIKEMVADWAFIKKVLDKGFALDIEGLKS